MARWVVRAALREAGVDQVPWIAAGAEVLDAGRPLPHLAALDARA